jgi:hypothetical protein
MDAGHSFGSLAWLAIGVGYGWSVWKLARMAKTAKSSDVEPPDSGVAIVVDEPAVPQRRA